MPGALPPYVDFAEYYDFDHAVTVDIEFYLEYAREHGSPILELACGTGRVLLPLARAGFDVHGVDVSANMLESCRRAVAREGLERKVRLHLAGMADFDLPRRDFALAFVALRSFMHLLTRADQEACLQRASEHLRPGGGLIVSAIAPDPVRLAQPPSEEFVVRREFDLPNGHHVVRLDRLVAHDPVEQVRHFEFRFEEFDPAGRRVRERLVPLYTRYLFRDELQQLLESAGFQVTEVFRDYRRNPYDGTGEMIAVAHRAP